MIFVATVAPPVVAVSAPLNQDVNKRVEFLGQLAAVNQVELRAQVGGTLTQIGFKDGDIVHKGDLLFEIDPTPYQIKLSEAAAQLESARARLDLANREAVRAGTLAKTGAGSVQIADQRVAEQRAAQAAVAEAEARVRRGRTPRIAQELTASILGNVLGNQLQLSEKYVSKINLLATYKRGHPIRHSALRCALRRTSPAKR